MIMLFFVLFMVFLCLIHQIDIVIHVIYIKSVFSKYTAIAVIQCHIKVIRLFRVKIYISNFKTPSIGAVTRLQDMGIEPFLLSSSLVAVMAQRLVRLVCTDCRVSAQATSSECEILGIDSSEGREIYHPKGCEKCNMTGYRGRTGIYELIEVDETLRAAIHEGQGEQAMLAVARQRYPGIQVDGQRRVLAGETTLEEVLRVTSVTLHGGV